MKKKDLIAFAFESRKRFSAFEETFTELIEFDSKITDEETIKILVKDYLKLIKFVCKKEKPVSFSVNKKYCYEITVNGCIYDLDMLIRHDDTVHTEMLMEIQSIFDERLSDEVVKIINKKINHRN